MISGELKSLKTGGRDLRKFGLLVGGVFIVLGLLWWARRKPHFAWALAPGVVLMAAGLVLPRALKHLFIAWMSVAMVMGLLVSTILLTAFFFLIIAPIGLVARLAGQDFLARKLDRKATSYWIGQKGKKPKVPADYERQF